MQTLSFFNSPSSHSRNVLLILLGIGFSQVIFFQNCLAVTIKSGNSTGFTIHATKASDSKTEQKPNSCNLSLNDYIAGLAQKEKLSNEDYMRSIEKKAQSEVSDQEAKNWLQTEDTAPATKKSPKLSLTDVKIGIVMDRIYADYQKLAEKECH